MRGIDAVKGYANCFPPETWTASAALAGGPNAFAPPVASAAIRNVVTVTNLTGSVTVVTVHLIITPERPMCLYDAGVLAAETLVYAIYDSRFSGPCWQKTIDFDGSEIGAPSVIKNGTTWQALPGPVALPDLGTFNGGFQLANSFFDVFYPVQLQPFQSLILNLDFAGSVNLGAISSGPQGSRYAVITNTLPPPCYANCDGSTTPPILNVLDFICFLNKFAAGDAYANCDGSTTPPVLNVRDFGCFLNQFAAGCP